MKYVTVCLVVFAALLVFGCATTTPNVLIPTVKDYTPKGQGFLIDFRFSNISQDEYNYLVAQIKETGKYQISRYTFQDGNAEIVVNVRYLDARIDLNNMVSSLQATYNGETARTIMFTPVGEFKEYVLARQVSGSAQAKYVLVSTKFDPDSTIQFGGFPVRTDKDGNAQFNGVGLGLANAKDGIIYIVDGMGNQVTVTRNAQNGQWYVEMKGQRLGVDVAESMVVEALR
jgi:uncharacterized lipoprotein NlpE involved in copper resistance